MRLIEIVVCIFMSVLIVLLFGVTCLLYDEVFEVWRSRRRRRKERGSDGRNVYTNRR